jgi:hypothetical protein
MGQFPFIQTVKIRVGKGRKDKVHFSKSAALRPETGLAAAKVQMVIAGHGGPIARRLPSRYC